MRQHFAEELTAEVDDESYIRFVLNRWLNIKSERSVLFVRRQAAVNGGLKRWCLILYPNQEAVNLYQRYGSAKGVTYLTPEEFIHECEVG
jgi:hypothetical protein